RDARFGSGARRPVARPALRPCRYGAVFRRARPASGQRRRPGHAGHGDHDPGRSRHPPPRFRPARTPSRGTHTRPRPDRNQRRVSRSRIQRQVALGRFACRPDDALRAGSRRGAERRSRPARRHADDGARDATRAHGAGRARDRRRAGRYPILRVYGGGRQQREARGSHPGRSPGGQGRSHQRPQRGRAHRRRWHGQAARWRENLRFDPSGWRGPMNLSDLSIRRPVFAAVVSLLLIVLGVMSFSRLTLRELPAIDPPIVSVEVNYPGASAAVVETRITQVLEDALAGIEGIETVQSSSRNGSADVSMEFKLSRDIEAATNDVRDAVSRVQDRLPEEADPPEISKVESDSDAIVWLNMRSDRMDSLELSDYAERYVSDRLSAIEGVARVFVGGGQ